jgi:hypothetical protein
MAAMSSACTLWIGTAGHSIACRSGVAWLPAGVVPAAVRAAAVAAADMTLRDFGKPRTSAPAARYTRKTGAGRGGIARSRLWGGFNHTLLAPTLAPQDLTAIQPRFSGISSTPLTVPRGPGPGSA